MIDRPRRVGDRRFGLVEEIYTVTFGDKTSMASLRAPLDPGPKTALLKVILCALLNLRL
jgi:hypothetical protein